MIGITNSSLVGMTKFNSKQTLVQQNSGAVATNTACYSNPAGKTFYCTGIVFSNGSAAAANFSISDYTRTFLLVNIGAGVCQSISGGILFSIPASTNLKIVHTTGGADGYVSLWGFTE